MSSKKRLPELLAPAGNRAALTAALQAGADAVYVGPKQFSMRCAPENFTLAQLKHARVQCHDAGAKLYVTVNTIIYDSERTALLKLLDGLAGVADAVICWDPAVFMACKERGIAFHISTQASVSNVVSAEYYKGLGAERIVLARECTLEDIRRIRKAVGIELEVFAHGAMCMSESGRCFLSQDVYGHSGNRGECRQPCRRPYRVICQDGPGDYEVTGGSRYIFSAKDLCTLPFLEKVLSSGVCSLKIEGRNRPADYVSTVIRAYRRGIDAWGKGLLTGELKGLLVEECRRVFNRDFSDGFYLGRPISEFTTVENSAATERRSQLGKVLNFYTKASVAHIRILAGELTDGDTVVIIGPTTGTVRCTISQVRLEKDEKTGWQTATFVVPQKVRENDDVYKLTIREG